MSTFRICALSFPPPGWRAILAVARASRRALRFARSVSHTGTNRILARASVLPALALLLFLLTPFAGRARPSAVSIPFRTVQTMILVEGKVGDKTVTFLLDTGANRTIVSARSYGDVHYPLRRAHRNRGGTGMTGEAVRLPVNLTLASHTWAGQPVSVMNLDDLEEALGIEFDGLLGQDILRAFRTVRIDYRNHTIELEE